MRFYHSVGVGSSPNILNAKFLGNLFGFLGFGLGLFLRLRLVVSGNIADQFLGQSSSQLQRHFDLDIVLKITDTEVSKIKVNRLAPAMHLCAGGSQLAQRNIQVFGFLNFFC